MTVGASAKQNPLPDLLPETFEIRLTMLSDWHVGSGAGRPGDIDSLVRRDADDLPYIPAKTVTGIWRDACERVALGLDNGRANGPWSKWVDYLFGDQPAIENAEWARSKNTEAAEPARNWQPPRSAEISIRSAHLPGDLQQALKTKPIARQAVTFVKPGISIHPRTGSARPDFLRFEELVRGEVSLFSSCEIHPMPEADRRTASALLIAGARMVERLGGKRRRGAGRCELQIHGSEDISSWLDWIERNPVPREPPPPQAEPKARQNHDHIEAAEGEWLRLPLQLTTKLPVIIPAGIVGNLIETLDYIPGTYLLPYLTKNLSGINTHAAIARGDLLVTNATIKIDGSQGRPVPFCLAYPKNRSGLKDGRDVINQLCERESTGVQLKNHREGYVGPTASLMTLPPFETVDSSVETHNVIKDDVQRPTESVGGVYSYQAIPASSRLRAEVRLRRSLCEELTANDPQWANKLKGQLRIGRANKDDYGLVELVVIGEPRLISASLDGRNAKQELTVWLLSDLLLRDERLRPSASTDNLRQALEAECNEGRDESQRVNLALKQQINVDGFWSFVTRQRRTDSWHVGWGLPRPSLAGLQAGTCVVFEVEGELDPESLARIEASGIGERRAEGYGQLSFNDPVVTSRIGTLTRETHKQTEESSAAFLISKESSFEYARLIETQAVQNELRRIAPGFATKPEQRKKALGIELVEGQSRPHMSQLGALLSTVSRLKQPGDEIHVLRWLEQVKSVKNRRTDWPDDSLNYVDELITNKERVWQLLEVDFTKLVLTKNGEVELKKDLWTDAVRTLIDACVRAHKRDSERKNNE